VKDLYFEDVHVGEKIVVGRHVADKDEMIEFARRWDPQVFHLDEGAAGAQHDGLLASSNYTMCVVTRVIGLDWHIRTFVARAHREHGVGG